MLGLRRICWPKFNLIGLFWFATAVTLGFAISKTTIEEPDNTLFGMSERGPYPPTLIAIGAVLAVYELVRQAKLLWTSSSHIPEQRPTLLLTICLRIGLAAGIVIALLFTQLINRGFLVPEEAADVGHIFGELWPSIILVLLLFASMRIMTQRPNVAMRSQSWQRLNSIIIGFGLALVFVYIIVDRNVINALVHLAIEGVEKSHAARWQRSDSFPNHRLEGYQVFWTSAQMVCLMGIGGLCLMLSAFSSRKWLTFFLGLTLLATVAQGLIYVRWFVVEEFFRINPDFATQSLPATKTELIRVC